MAAARDRDLGRPRREGRRQPVSDQLAELLAQSEGDFDTQAVRYLDMSDCASKWVRNVPVVREMLCPLNLRGSSPVRLEGPPRR